MAGRFADKLGREFVVNVEAVPPAHAACGGLIDKIVGALHGLPIDAINLADSPMACARMSPLLFANELRRIAGERYDVIPHFTVRDHNRVALQGMMWGALASGMHSVLIVSGDPVRLSDDPRTHQVTDLTVPDAVRLGRESELHVGVVMDPTPARRASELRKLDEKRDAGAQFVITQPLFQEETVDDLCGALEQLGLPVLLGILPLVSLRHARFLDGRVPGIVVPRHLIESMEAAAPDSERERSVGVANARAMLARARQSLAGACLMPPFERFQLVGEVLG